MIARALAAVALAWALGFALFMLLLPGPLDGHPTDAIVVPTGAAGRIDRGISLIEAHAAKRMLITGVAPTVRPIDLALEYHAAPALFACCIDLGRQAVDTRSNAEETARWVRAHHYHSVRLVTSDWHMARARMELGNSLDDDVVIVRDGVKGDPSLTLLLAEYNKLLLRRASLWLGIGDVIVWARTAAFRIVFYGLSVPIVLLAPVAALFGQRALIRYTQGWAVVHRWSARALAGITTRVEGTPLATPALYAAKHQAMFETIELALILDAPVLVMKAELARIPVWGWAARRYGVIVVDRAGAGQTMRQMMREARAALEADRSIVIFPEGTRVRPGQKPPLRAGFAGLYRALGVPVVPLALDSGRLWPREGPTRPGTVTFRFGGAIPPGLPRADAEAQVHAAINALEN